VERGEEGARSLAVGQVAAWCSIAFSCVFNSLSCTDLIQKFEPSLFAANTVVVPDALVTSTPAAALLAPASGPRQVGSLALGTSCSGCHCPRGRGLGL
jgi:hypothetical protein